MPALALGQGVELRPGPDREVVAGVGGGGPHRGHVHVGGLRLASLEALPDDRLHQRLVVADQADRGAESDGVPHHDVLAGLSRPAQRGQRLLQHLEVRDGVELDVLALETRLIDLEIGVVDDAAARHHLVDVPGVARVLLALRGVAEKRLLVERHQHVDGVEVGMDRRGRRRHPVVAVLAHDVGVELDVGEDPEPATGQGPREQLRRSVDAPALRTAEHPG